MYLNRELIQFPDGVRDRTAAIQHRLKTAGLKRKIGKNQVQAIHIVLTGTHADMEQIEQTGRLDKWCKDSLEWLRKTYGADNVVAAVLHMDEETPHIHATIVPIVQTERKKHISTHEYYRSLIAQGEGLQANITQLLEEQEKARQVIAEAEQAKKDLARIKNEAKTEELKISATKTATAALNGINSLLGSNKVSRLEKENTQLHKEVEDLNGQIERLRTDMQKMKDSHARELNRTNEQHQQAMSNLKRLLDKAYRWFPSFKRFLNMERECLGYGFSEEQTDKLLHGQNVNYSGWLTRTSTGIMHLQIMSRHKL